MRGRPLLIRLMGNGLLKPKFTMLGTDIAGRVEAVGGSVTTLRVADEAFGNTSACDWGGSAECVCAPEACVAPKPARLTFGQAAAVPLAGLTAWQGLRDHRRIQCGQNVLINGASGGVGTFAVQIAKSFGTQVTGVCSTRHREMVRSLGAD